MISLSQVSKIYPSSRGDITALNTINLQVAAGEIVGVVGKSGAGKSTLIRCVNLLERPTTGSVKIAGQELMTMRKRELIAARRQFGMIFQHFNLLQSATVYDNVALPLLLAGHTRKEIGRVIEPLLDLVHLTEKKAAYPKTLSGGQKQRVAIARALVNKPKVLLCDEATSALDPQTTKNILALLDEINQKVGVTILLITHEMAVIKQICDRVAVLEKGQIIEQATTGEFFIKPKTAIASMLARSSLNYDLPPAIANNIAAQFVAGSKPLLRIMFQGETTQEPLISDVVRQFGLELNILQANIETIHKLMLGIMIVEIFNPTDSLPKAISYLESKGLTIHHLGYLQHANY